jgi:lipopolysaccharide transport system ATP-binding protein
MRSDIAISVSNVTKTYRIFDHPGDRIKQALTLGRLRFHREFTALKSVSFEVKRGEALGIIGRNGSGKSTLLQLICGILKPTSGAVKVDGRVSALLELGAGFNTEFTGRENVYFQGAVMGISRAEMDRRFKGIAAFAEIGEFIDQPVRIYSSGMYLRLAFAVAVNVDSEILVVDEALAVGDAGFRARCFRRIAELRKAGCTILLVSHSMEQIVSLCDRTLLLDGGELILLGGSKSMVKQYQRLVGSEAGAILKVREEIRQLAAPADVVTSDSESTPSQLDIEECYDPTIFSDSAMAYEPNGALIESVRILTLSGERVNQLLSGSRYRCAYRVRFLRNATLVRCAMLIKTTAGVDLGGAYSTPIAGTGVPGLQAGFTAEVEFEFRCMLNAGVYFVNVSVFDNLANVEFALHGIVDAEKFKVMTNQEFLGLSIVDFDCRPTIRSSAPSKQ